MNATGTDTNTNLLGNVANDSIQTTGFNNTNAQYWGTATVTSNGVAHNGIIVQDPNGGGHYYFLTGATVADLSGALSTTAAQSSPGTNVWTLAGTGTPAAPTFTVSDNVGSIQSNNLADGSSTDDTTLTLSGTAGAGATVRIYDGSTSGTPIGTVVAGPNGSWSYTTNALSHGAHTLNVTQKGTGGTTSAVTGFAVTVDTAAPSAPTIGTVSDNVGLFQGNLSNGASTDDSTLALSGTAEAGATVQVFNGTTLVGTTSATGNGSWSLTTSALPEGAVSLTAKAVDAAGNTSGASAAFTATADTTPPTGTTTIGFAQDTGTPGDGVTANPALT